MLAVYLPLIVLAALCAALFMDNLAPVKADTGAIAAVVREKHTWLMSALYIGTFGSFIGFSFAFGLVLQNQFGRTALQAAQLTFLGPLLGSLARPLGGKLADRWGGARITLWNFAAMAAAAGTVTWASAIRSLPLFLTGFVALFALAGLGNGSTYKMIPGIFDAKAQDLIADGTTPADAAAWSRRMSGAAIGVIGAVGALGGLFINLAFRESFRTVHTGTPAFVTFLAAYAACSLLTWAVYLRRPAAAPHGADAPAPARV